MFFRILNCQQGSLASFWGTFFPSSRGWPLEGEETVRLFSVYMVRQIYDIISACMPEECEFLKKSSGKCRKFFPATVCIVRMP